MGPYKMAKASLLAMAQSLATELGPQGIRVNSVAPGHIWGESLKWYFGYLAKKRGVDPDEIYAGDGGQHRPRQAAGAGRDRRRRAVPRLAAGARHHRSVPRRQLRRVPPLSHADDRPAERDNVGTVEDLHDSASRLTGLTDFGADDYSDGLAVILESYARDADLTPLGQKVARVGLRGALAARLLAKRGLGRPSRARRRCPSTGRIFVTGLPRSGTTALHRLLTADPAHQGLELWLAEMPQPRPPRDTWAANPVFQHIQAGYQRHHVEHPEFMGVHYIAADTVEECWQLLRQTLRSVSYECLAHLPTYSAWLQRPGLDRPVPAAPANLQLIGLNDAGQRWVLKNPSHLFALDAIMAVYPDALIIQTHREPRGRDRVHVQPGRACDRRLVGHVPGQRSSAPTSSSCGRAGWRSSPPPGQAIDQAQFLDVDYAGLHRRPDRHSRVGLRAFRPPVHAAPPRTPCGPLHAEAAAR